VETNSVLPKQEPYTGLQLKESDHDVGKIINQGPPSSPTLYPDATTVGSGSTFAENDGRCARVTVQFGSEGVQSTECIRSTASIGLHG
jgi:hypothetical protein